MNIKVENLDEALTKDFVNFCCKELDIAPNYIEIIGDENVGDRTGACIDLNENDFMIIVETHNRNMTQIYTTIAHEMVHVKQYMKEDLGSLLDKDKTPYFQRWWETEAREKSLNFVKKFVDILERIG